MAEFVFQGTSALTLDGKGRVNVPARHRDALMASTNGQLTLTKHPVGCLLVFPRPAWEQFRDKLLGLPFAADGVRRVFLGNAMLGVPPDIDVKTQIVAREIKAEEESF